MPALDLTADTLQRNASTLIGSYLCLLTVLVVAAIGFRRAAGSWAVYRPGPPTPSEVAILVSRVRAVHSALAALRAAGCLAPGTGRGLTATAPAPASLDELCHAVHDAVGRGTSVRRIATDRRVASALREIEESARGTGWLVSPRMLRLARLGGFAALALMLSGLASALLGPAYTLLALPPSVLAIVLATVRRTTPAGRQQWEATWVTTAHLHPRNAGSWTTHGPSGAAASVALYGVGALWAADPAFARAAQLPRLPVPPPPRVVSGQRWAEPSGGWPGYSDYDGEYDSGGWGEASLTGA